MVSELVWVAFSAVPALVDLLLPQASPPGHLTFLHNVSTLPSFRKQSSSKVSMPWSSTIAVVVCALQKTAVLVACITSYLGFLPAHGKTYHPIPQEFQVTFGVPMSLQILIWNLA